MVEVRGDKVRLGIDAPKDVPVHRKEIYNAIRSGEKRDEYANKSTPVSESDFHEVAAEVEKTLTPNLGWSKWTKACAFAQAFAQG